MIVQLKDKFYSIKEFIRSNKTALLISLFGFLFLLAFNFTWPFITGDDIEYIRSTEGVYWTGSPWDMARPGQQVFNEIGYLMGGNNPFWFYLIKNACFFIFIFFFYKIAKMLFEEEMWAILATFFVMLVYPVAFGFTWLSETRAFSAAFTLISFWFFLEYIVAPDSEQHLKKKRWAYGSLVLLFSFIAASFNQTARFIPVIFALFILIEWLLNRKDLTTLLPAITVTIASFCVLIILWFTFRIAVNYSLQFSGKAYLYFFRVVLEHTKYFFYLIALLIAISTVNNFFYFKIGFNTPQLAAPILKLEIAGRESKKFARIPPQLAGWMRIFKQFLYWKTVIAKIKKWVLKQEKTRTITLFIVSWVSVTILYSGFYGVGVNEERYALPLFVPFILFLFFILFKLYKNIKNKVLKRLSLLMLVIIIMQGALFTLNTLLIFGNQFIAFNDARVYLNTIEQNAVVIYQSGTDDLWDYNSTNTFIRPGYGLQQTLDTIQTYQNKTIYLVEYPKPWTTTIADVPNKQLIQSINYWPIELHIYLYSGNKPKNPSYVDYSFQPHTGYSFFYYTYTDEKQLEKVFLNGKIILGKEKIALIVPNRFLRTILSPLARIKIKGRGVDILQ